MADSSGIRRRIVKQPDNDVVIQQNDDSTEKQKTRQKKWSSWYFPALLTFLAFATRFYRIARWNKVIWDEAHFGKFGSNYINRNYFFDLHPPLGKMLIALGGWLGGYRGNWGFESEKVYPNDVPWKFWRMWCGVFGALTVPLAYYTALDMGLRKRGAFLAGLMVLTELGFITLARFILLDPFLLFFTALTTFCWVRFWSLRNQAFSKRWWFWLLMTGVNLGNTSSVKWLGLFMVATVGVHTIMDLWLLLADPRTTYRQYGLHWIARIVCLILVPLMVYAFWFDVHFKVLNNYGWQASEMPSSFQLRYKPNAFDGLPSRVAYNSKVRIKSGAWNGYHLQSVKGFDYPAGSKQQVVTGSRYPHSDNDRWMVERPWPVVEEEKKQHGFRSTDEWRKLDEERDKKKVQFIKNGDIIRLNHVPSGQNLHSHPIRANLTGRDWEATVFYTRDYGDPNDMWVVETIGVLPFLPGSRYVDTLYSRFLLRHNDSGCYLKAQTRQMPDWGGGPGTFEVTCSKWTAWWDPHVSWYIDGHDHKYLPKTPQGYYKPSLMLDLVAINVGMGSANNMLVDDPNKEPEPFQSFPIQWPLLVKGLRICNWDDWNVKYFMFGNPINWWGGAFSIAFFLFMTFAYTALLERGAVKWTRSESEQYWFAGLNVCLLGWAFHYFPFYLMPRVLYLHHYHPALYFAILAFAFVTDHAAQRWMPRKHVNTPYVVVGVIVLAMFFFFKDLAFGMEGPSAAYRNRKWLKGWDLWQPERAKTPEDEASEKA